MHPVLFKIGSFEFASYGLMTALGYLAAVLYLLPRLKKINLDKDTFWNIIFIAFAGALLGGKLLYILVSWQDLGPTLGDKLANIVKGFRYGFVFFGGAIAAVGALIWYIRRKKQSVLKVGDLLIVALPLGHAIGRIGCFLAGCCFGKPTHSHFGVVFSDPHSLVDPALLGVHLHPVQLYESMCNLLLFVFLHHAYKRPHKTGSILVLYAVGYGIIRFGLEFFRGDFRGNFILGLSPSQLLSVAAVLTGLTVLYFLHKGNKNAH